MGRILAWTPFDLVNLLLYFEGFEVVEFGLVRLEFGIELVFAALFLEKWVQYMSFGEFAV